MMYDKRYNPSFWNREWIDALRDVLSDDEYLKLLKIAKNNRKDLNLTESKFKILSILGISKRGYPFGMKDSILIVHIEACLRDSKLSKVKVGDIIRSYGLSDRGSIILCNLLKFKSNRNVGFIRLYKLHFILERLRSVRVKNREYSEYVVIRKKTIEDYLNEKLSNMKLPC